MKPEALFFAICATACVARAMFVAVGLMLAVSAMLVWACVGRRRLVQKRMNSRLALIVSCMSFCHQIREITVSDWDVRNVGPKTRQQELDDMHHP